MTREVGAPLVVSDDVVQCVKLEDHGASSLADLCRNGSATVPGRASKIDVWTLDPKSGGAPA